MITTFLPTFAGFHFGIMFTARKALSSTSLLRLFFISVSRLVPSDSTTKLTRAILYLQSAVFLKFSLIKVCIAILPLGYTASSSTT